MVTFVTAKTAHPTPPQTPTADLGDAAPRRRGGFVTPQTWVGPPAQSGSCWQVKRPLGLRLLSPLPRARKTPFLKLPKGKTPKGV